jgi:hypothetical protein
MKLPDTFRKPALNLLMRLEESAVGENQIVLEHHRPNFRLKYLFNTAEAGLIDAVDRSALKGYAHPGGCPEGILFSRDTNTVVIPRVSVGFPTIYFHYLHCALRRSIGYEAA